MEENKKNKNKLKIINDFPLIIVIAVAIIAIVLVNLYLGSKPFGTIYRDGYMVLNDNMTYNLVNKSIINDDMDVGVAPVYNGYYIYKQIDSYYVGVEDKVEIDYDYPIYSTDGLTIYNINDNVMLIDKNFNRIDGYKGFSINYGILYNEGDSDPADDIDYLFLYLNNSIYINTQIITIKTLTNEYNIPLNSPIYFNLQYINYYTFDGKNFKYQRISDIYYDSIIRIGNISLTYEEFLLKMNLARETQGQDNNTSSNPNDGNTSDDNLDNEQNSGDGYVNQNTNPGSQEVEFIKPTVTASEFTSSVFSISSSIIIDDPTGAISSSPSFEVYESGNKLFSRKRVSSSGDFKISGLSSNKEYRIVGSYKYKNQNGNDIIVTFFEQTIKTKTIDGLDDILISSDIGDRYPNKIELKDLTILNKDTEAVLGIKKIVINIKKNGENVTSYTLPYTKISKILKGEPTTITTNDKLESSTVYNYEIKFYDRDDNELKARGDINGIIQTSKTPPKVTYTSNSDKTNNRITITINTKNVDEVYIKDYKYELYTYSGTLLESGGLNHLNDSSNKLIFDSLDYNSNYIIKVSGTYDLEDGREVQQLEEIIDFTTVNLSDNFIAWYDEDTLNVTSDSITTDVYISLNTSVLERDTTTITLYLADRDGNDILDENGELKYSKTYTKAEYTSPDSIAYHIENIFDNLDSNTEYILKVRINVKQIEKNLYLTKTLNPSIKTRSKDAYITIINKQLLGDTLDLLFEISDPDSLIKDGKGIIEIYEGKYTSTKDINARAIYRTIFNIQNSNLVSITLKDYTLDSYTVVVSADNYNGVNVKKYIEVIGNLEENPDLINIDRDIKAYSEMYEQRFVEGSNSSKYNTKINIKYNLGDSKTDLYLVDCNESTCTNLGYIDSDNKFYPFKNNNNYTIEELENKQGTVKRRLTIPNDKKDENHTFYIVVEKPEINLRNVEHFNITSIDKELYTLTSLEYSTNYEIYNIDEARDFYDTNLIKRSGETKHYVVTENIDFNTQLITSAILSNFGGTIDFQGYSVKLYRNNTSNLTLFSSISKTGVLKNLVINYSLEYDGVITTLPGFVNTNSGTLQNVVVNVNQLYENGRAYALGLLAYSNSGTIENFVVYLQSDIHTYSASSIVTYTNNASGVIKNGYVTTELNSLYEKRVILHDVSAYHGTFTVDNSGTIEYVYNLVSVVSAEENYTNSSNRGIATIVNRNVNSGILRNTLSVATTTQTTSKLGPNIYGKAGTIKNNYYVDTNLEQLGYNDSYNKRLNPVSLRNRGVLEVILNKDNGFTITSGYYPMVKMSRFMDDYQKLISIAYDYREATVDIISAESIDDNNLNDTRKAKATIYVNNPDKVTVDEVILENLSNEIIDQKYDEASKVTELTVELFLDGNEGKAMNSYNIVEIKYTDPLGGKHTRTYDETDKRNIEIEMYRYISDYESLVSSIDKNENIYIISDITVSRANIDNVLLPKASQTYSSKFLANNKTIDFNDFNITRGYFIYNFTGRLENLKVKNIKFSSTELFIGFIRATSGGTITDVDINNIEITIERKNNNVSTSSIYVGSLIGQAQSTTITNASVNNSKIRKATDDYSGIIYSNYIGGLIGYAPSTTIRNSYVYNVDINISLDTYIGYKSIGGLVGYSNSTTIENTYVIGNIDTGYSNVGGITGIDRNSYIRYSYSYVNITSTGDFVGGIAGKFTANGYRTDSIIYCMNIGKIINKNLNKNYSQIVPTRIEKVASNNYAFEEDDFISVTTIDKNGFKTFDRNNVFDQQESIESQYYLPYLKQSSSVEQSAKDLYYVEKVTSDDIKYTVEYDDDDECKIGDIKDIFDESKTISSDLYTHACAKSATLNLELPGGYELIITKKDSNEETNSDGTLSMIKKDNGTYTVKPNDAFLNYYTVKIRHGDTTIDLNLEIPFYRSVSNLDEWNKISTDKYENVILLSDINLKSDEESYKSSANKNIYNLLGNGYEIRLENSDDNTSINDHLINILDGTLRDLNFKDIKMSNLNEDYSGMIRYNNGLIENCKFENMTITSSKSYVGIVAQSPGDIKNVKMSKINVSGVSYVGGLVGYNSEEVYNEEKINNINANEINVTGTGNYVGGIAGYIDYTISDITASKINVKGVSYIGGIVGRGDATKITISESMTETTGGSYIGGVAGTYSYSTTKTDINVTNVDIQQSTTKSSTYVGGIYGTGPVVTKSKVDKVVIGKKSDQEETYTNFVGSQVGGLIGNGSVTYSEISNSYISGSSYVGGMIGNGSYANSSNVESSQITNTGSYTGGLLGNGSYSNGSTVTDSQINGKDYTGGLLGNGAYSSNSKVSDTSIKGNDYVGGLLGNSSSYTTQGNAVLNVNIEANNRVGGLFGQISSSPTIQDNMVLKSTITAKDYIGGVIGYINNNTTSSQNLIFKGNFTLGTIINTESVKNTGKILGYIYQVPASTDIRYTYSLFNGNVKLNSEECNSCSLIGTIENKNTGSQTGFGSGEITLEDFYAKSNFKEYVGDIESLKDYQMNSISALNEFVKNYNTTSYKEAFVEDDTTYFPIFKNNNYAKFDEKYYVKIPYDSESGTVQEDELGYSTKYFMPTNIRNYSKFYSNNLNMDYDIYASDVDKINLEFSKLNPNAYFYYKIGDYISEYISINKRTFTIPYNFKDSFEIYITNGVNNKTEKISADKLKKTLSLVDNQVYYLNDTFLYSETSIISGNFVNLYNDKVLTSDGHIYNIRSKEESEAIKDYTVLESDMPLYTFIYNGKTIKTYYNYSTVDSDIKEYQIFVKNGNMSMIGDMKNKRDSYIVDYYNNNEVQIILKDNGVLYSIKNNIKYPESLQNRDIKELYTDINSSSSVVTLKYQDGTVYKFDYITGKELFNNITEHNVSFFDYVSSKLSNKSYNTIESLVSTNKYVEIELLKDKLSNTSVEDAKNQLQNNNSSSSVNKNYITVYNDITQNYDIYSIEDITEDDTLESETNKIYKDYELVQFYVNPSKKSNKFPLNGVVIFGLSIVAILVSLTLLIKRKKNLKEIA